MIRVLGTLLTIRTSSAINLFFYYVQKLPLVGALVTNRAYARTDLKRSAAVLVFIVLLLWSLVSKLVYLFLLVYLPVKAAPHAHEPLMLFIHIFVLISFLVAGISSANVLEPKREKYVAVKLMRMSPKYYMHAFLAYRYVVFLISYIPALLVFVLLLQGTALQAVTLAVAVAAWRVLCEYVHLKLFEKTSIVLIKKVAAVWIAIAAGYIAAYLPFFIERLPIIGPAFTHWAAPLVIAVPGAWAAVQLVRYRHFREAVDAATGRDDPYLNVSGMIADAQKTSMRAKESDYSEDILRRDAGKGKEGYAYLNAIFLARHRSLVSRPVHKRLAIIAVAAIIGSIAMLVMGRVRPEFLQMEFSWLFPVLPIGFYFLTVGETTCKAMFYHCDISLTRYSFYRNAAHEHFFIRLRRMVGQNVLIAAVFGVAATIVIWAAGGSIVQLDAVLFWLSIVALAVFFTIHHLFLYYIFQPYSTDLNIKNPLYFVVSMVVSAACGLSIFSPVPPAVFTITVVSIATVYFAVAALCVRKYAHKTFRVK